MNLFSSLFCHRGPVARGIAASRFAAAVVAAGAGPSAAAPEGAGYSDTPFLPNSKWRVHDIKRPQPPMVVAGSQAGDPPSDAIVLFDGKDLAQWVNAKPAGLENGLINVYKTGTIWTKQTFGDCQLHVEWAVPAKPDAGPMEWGNSGVFMMGKCELQIIESHDHKIYADGIAGAIYGQTPPRVNVSRKPGQWETYDIVFLAPRFSGGKLVSPAYFTVFWNGVLVQYHKPVLGWTIHRAVATYNSTESTGPIGLQDHNSGVRFRNIWVRPLKSEQP